MPLMNRPRVVINGTRRTRTYRFFWCRQCDRTPLFQELHISRPSNLLSNNSQLSSSSSSVSPAQLIDTMSQIINLSSQPRRVSASQENSEPSDQMTHDQTAENRTSSGITEFRMTADAVCSEPTCSICKEDFVVNEEIRKLGCNHLYHFDCITPWLQINNTCPVCRFELPPQQGCSHGHGYNDRDRSSSTNFRAANYSHDYDFYGDYNLRFEEVMNLSWPNWAELFSFVWPFRLAALLDWSFPS
ncbi:hypothetical protein RDABS01_038766 [Bienertia sinuspersici]